MHSFKFLFASRLSDLSSKSNPTKPFQSFLSTLSLPTQDSEQKDSVVRYLFSTFKFSQAQLPYISNRFSHVRCSDTPLSVLKYFQEVGFSETHIRSIVQVTPQVLFSDVEKTLKPKIEFFLQLGFVTSDLGNFLSKDSTLLLLSLEKTLLPCVQTIKSILYKDKNNEDLIRVMKKCGWQLRKFRNSNVLCNVDFLKSCGIVGSQLSMLLKRQPHIFLAKESFLREVVSRTTDMGFLLNSKMLVHGLHSICSLSEKTIRKKLELFQSSGFTEDECMDMFRRAPCLLRTSEDKLKFGFEFYLNTLKLHKSVLVNAPSCFMYSMEERVIPRYRVLQLIKSEELMRKEPGLIYILSVTEKEFLEKFISRFKEHTEKLLKIYKGHLLDSSLEEES